MSYEVYYEVWENDLLMDHYVCFKHAVLAAMSGARIETIVDDDAGSSYRMGRTWCERCTTEREAARNASEETGRGGVPKTGPKASVPSVRR